MQATNPPSSSQGTSNKDTSHKDSAHKSIAFAEKALQQAQAIQDAAEKGEWQNVDTLQKEQNQLVSTIDVFDITEADAETVRTILTQAKALNDSATLLAIAFKNSLIQEKKTKDKADKMKKALNVFKSL